MIWNEHKDLKDTHAFLSASQHSWLNYDEAKCAERFLNFEAAKRGTMLHSYAAKDIQIGKEFGIMRPANGKTYETYVNDGIKYRMNTEQILYFSPFAYGTADTISFRRNLLRIHDLKTGVIPAKMEQLEIYAGLFCLEYRQKPSNIKMELRIYQNNQIVVMNYDNNPDMPSDISRIMEKIIELDGVIRKLNAEEL